MLYTKKHVQRVSGLKLERGFRAGDILFEICMELIMRTMETVFLIGQHIDHTEKHNVLKCKLSGILMYLLGR